MPIAAFIDDGHLPSLGLTNAWGYNPVAYFAVDPRLAPRGPQELRHMTDLYRKNGISVILDVVYNHTGEGDAMGPVLSHEGARRQDLLPARRSRRQAASRQRHRHRQHAALRPSGGAAAGDREPALLGRGDSASPASASISRPILGREPGFNPNAKMLQMIKADPVLSKCLLVAEPWDPGPGGYQLGQFGKEFREHNDTYRDEIRSFWRGDDGKIGALAGKVAGSAEIFNFAGRKPSARRQLARRA